MHRRRLTALALLGVLAALSGCSAAGSVSLTAVDDDASLAAEASRSLDAAEAPHQAHRNRIARAAIAEGSSRVTAVRPPVERGLPFAFEGRYYGVNWSVVDRKPGYAVSVGLDYNATDPSGARVAFADLPTVDRRALRPLLDTEPPRLEPGPDWGYATAYTRSTANRSVLVPDAEYDVVTYRGEAYPVDVDVREETTVTRYRYDASVVANDSEAYADRLRRTYAFRPSNLTDGEREILDEAAGGTYYADSDADEAFDRLVDRFRAHRPVQRDSGYREGNWLVRYDGTLYWVELYYGEFVDATPSESETPAVTPH